MVRAFNRRHEASHVGLQIKPREQPDSNEEGSARSSHSRRSAMRVYFDKKVTQLREGKAGYILLWLLGVPLPILFAIYLLRGCN
jgi:hypothetical protein